MSTLATTKLSSKGQVVIPENIRIKIGLHTGDQFVIVADKDVVILKIIKQPAMEEFATLAAKARKMAKKVGLSKSSVRNAIKEARNK